MYRNCRMGRCHCTSCNADKDSVLEDICDDVLPLTDCNNYNECACGFDEEESPFPSNPMFGQSYVPNQVLNTTFTPEVGLKMGTIFPELVSPYMPCQSMEEIEFIRKMNQIKEGCNRV